MKWFHLLTFSIFLSFYLSIFPLSSVLANYVENDYPSGIDAAIQEDDLNTPGFTATQMNNIISDLVRIGIGPIPGVTTLSQDKQYLSQMYQKSALGGVSRGIALVYANPPASFGPWLADVGHTLGFIPNQVYAQGIGFSGLAPLLPIWKAFRNIAYLVLAIVMIVIGFMVMLRKKIDPKTVVTVQNALPRIVMTLILITFSYAIVGFLIDLMYLLMLLGITVIGSSMKGGADIPELQALFTSGGFGGVFKIFDPLWFTTQISIPGGLGLLALLTLLLHAPVAIITGILVIATGVGGATGGIALTIASPLLLLLLGLGLIVTLVKILFMVVNAYIQVIISLLFGPLQIMLDAIPGSNGFSSWLNNLIVNLLTFPITAILIIVAASVSSNIDGNFWTAPLVPNALNASGFIRALLGIGIVMSIPNIVKAVKEALKIKPMMPTGAGVLAQPVLGAAGGVMQLGSQFFYTSQIWDRFKPKPKTP